MNYETRITNNNPSRRRGFTIIETLVAVSILVIAVTGPLSLASKGLAYSQYAKDEITAFYLANEALDAVRNVRDSNLRSGNPSWLQLPGGTPTSPKTLISECGNGCSFDVWGNPLMNIRSNFWNDAAATKIKTCYIGEKVFFGHSFVGLGTDCNTTPPQPDSIFSRKVVVKDIDSDALGFTEIKVDVLVSWTAKNGLPRNVILSENLFRLGSL